MNLSVPTHHGVFVGINRYASTNLVDLNFCVNDALEMREVLTNDHTGLISPDASVLLTDSDATKTRVMASIADVVKKLHTGDTLTIYWASHGTRPASDRNELYLITHDTETDGHEVTNAIKFIQELVPLFQDTDNFVMVLLDGCSVGDALARPIIAQNENIGIMAATKRDEHALEAEPLKHGVFTYHLLLTLRSPDVDADGDNHISMEEAHAYTYKPVLDYVAKNFPGHPQHPTVAGNNIHRMALIRQSIRQDSMRAR